MTYGVTDTGFICPTYAEILADLKAQAQSYFGADIDLTAKSPLGQFIAVVAYQITLNWQILEQIYYSGFLKYAEGSNLDDMATLLGVERNPATPATGEVTFTGTNGTTIPAFFKVSIGSGLITFHTTEAGTIDETEAVTVPIVAEVLGVAGNVDIGAIRKQVNPRTGVTGVTNAAALTNGAPAESDAAFRLRVQYAFGTANATKDAVWAKIMATDGVTMVNLIEDYTNSIVTAVVMGGNDTEVQDAIDASRACGIEYELVRPLEKSITIDATIVFAEGVVNKASIIDTIEAGITAYLGDIAIGESVNYSQIAKQILKVTGVDDIATVTLTCGEDVAVAFGESIAIAATEIAVAGTITITEVAE